MKSQRLLAIGGLGLLVLAVASLAYFGRLAFEPHDDPVDPIVAIVNDHPIRDSYVTARINEMALGEQIALREQRTRFLESLIMEEMLLQSMLSTNFADEPQLRDKVKAVVGDHLITKHVGERIVVSEEEARAYYAANQRVIRGETVQVSHIVLEDRAQCEELMASIDSDEEFEAAARQRSLHPETGPRGGALGRVMNHDGTLGFEQQMFEMNDDEMKVFDAIDGCHLVRAGERQVPPLPAYEDVRERIHALLRRQEEIRLLSELERELRARIEVHMPGQ